MGVSADFSADMGFSSKLAMPFDTFASVSLRVTTPLRLSLFVDCGFGIHNFHHVFDSDGLLNQTVVEFGHESFFGRSGPHAPVVFQRSLRFS